MINFSINSNESSISSKKNSRLAPFEIHHVTFDGAEIKSGTSKAGNDFKLLQLSFSNENGSAELTIFWPNPEKDGIREVRTAKDGHEYETPSRWENTWNIMKQTLETLSQKGYEKFAEVVSKCTGKTQEEKLDKVFKYYVEILNKSIGSDVDIKFNGYINKQGYTQLTFPNIVGINKKGELFISDNYIGHGNVGLSDYELRRGKELSSAKPTEMKPDPIMDTPETTEEASDDDELNFDDL